MLPVNPPGPWQYFTERVDNRGLSTVKIREKYLKEQLLFENFVNYQNFQNQQAIAQTAQGYGGGAVYGVESAPVTYDLTFTVDIQSDGQYFRFNIGTVEGGGTDATIYWGDGTEETVTIDPATSPSQNYTYATAGTYIINVNFTNPENVYSVTADQND